VLPCFRDLIARPKKFFPSKTAIKKRQVFHDTMEDENLAVNQRRFEPRFETPQLKQDDQLSSVKKRLTYAGHGV
jgi:hypothetical protein